MPKKLTIEFVREQFEAEGYIFLTKEYANCTQKLKYICPKGHCWSITWNDWRNGCRCAMCFGSKKHTLEFIWAEFEKEGYVLLTKKYINAFQDLQYICPEGHKDVITWHSWQQGCRCSTCKGNKKLTIEFIKLQFKKEKYVLLTEKYLNNKDPLEYICPKGHKGNIRWDNWQHGSRCQICYRENNKGENHPRWSSFLTEEDRQDRRLILGYDNWRFNVYNRDKSICRVCGKTGEEAHHLESYNSNPDLRTVLNNGVCLCEQCHKNFHHQYGYGNNTKEQFKEFINNYNKKSAAK